MTMWMLVNWKILVTILGKIFFSEHHLPYFYVENYSDFHTKQENQQSDETPYL